MTSNPEFEIIRELIGKELAAAIQEKLGGCKLYIPAVSKSDRLNRNAKIVAEYDFGNGLTPNELAVKYRLSEPHIRKIIAPKNVSS